MCAKGKKKSITARSICYAVYILKDHYLYKDFNISITLRGALGEGRGCHSLNHGGFHSAELCRLMFANGMSFPKLLQKKKNPAHCPGGWRKSKYVFPFGKGQVLLACAQSVWDGLGDGGEGKT